MVVVRQQRKSRLSTMIDAAGGLSVSVAKAQALANLNVMRPRGLDIIKAQIAELAAMTAPSGPDDRAVSRAYGLSAGIVDAAGPFEMNDLCRAASGLCDLLDAAPEGETFDWRIVTVHVQAMQLMLALPDGDEGEAARAKVLDGLDEMLRVKLQPAA